MDAILSLVLPNEGSGHSEYRILNEEEMDLHLVRRRPFRNAEGYREDKWESIESTGVESDDNNLEEATIFLVRLALRDSRG